MSACKYVSIALRGRSCWRVEWLDEADESETKMEGRGNRKFRAGGGRKCRGTMKENYEGTC